MRQRLNTSPLFPSDDFPSGRTGVARPDPILSRLLWQWLLLAVLVSPWLPAALVDRIGSTWLWAVAMPLAALLALHREVLAAAGRRLLVPAPVVARQRALAPAPRPMPADRGGIAMPSQARRLHRRSASVAAQARAA